MAKSSGLGSMCGRGLVRIADVIDIEMHSARKMTAAILGAAVEISADVMPRAVEDAQVWVGEMFREPMAPTSA